MSCLTNRYRTLSVATEGRNEREREQCEHERSPSSLPPPFSLFCATFLFGALDHVPVFPLPSLSPSVFAINNPFAPISESERSKSGERMREERECAIDKTLRRRRSSAIMTRKQREEDLFRRSQPSRITSRNLFRVSLAHRDVAEVRPMD